MNKILAPIICIILCIGFTACTTLDWIRDKIPGGTTTTTTTTIPPADTGDHPALIHTQGGDMPWSEMVETAKILESTFDASGFWSRTDRKWPVVQDNNPEGDGYLQDGTICLIWQHPVTGVWQGEYVDCSVAKDYKYVSYRQHCLDSSSPFAGRLPANGQRVGNVFVSNDGKQRTSIAWGVWPL